MPERNSRTNRGLLGVVLGLQVALGLVLAQLYLTTHHSLRNNGNWTATKTTLSKGVMGAHAFVYSLQPLAGGRLDLSAWHGHQEVVLAREVDPVTVEFDFQLYPGAYLVFGFGKPEDRYTGLRLSRNPHFPPIVATVSPDGRFLRKRRFPKLRSARAERWQTVRIEFGKKKALVFLDGRELRRVGLATEGPQRLVFRAGRRGALIDNVRIVERDGRVFRDTFRQPRTWLWVNALAAGATLLFSLLLFLVLRRFLAASERLLLFNFLMFSVVLLVIAGALYAVVSQRKEFYPDASERLRREEAYWKGATAERIFSRIENEVSPEPDANTHRVVFVGSSQTFGSGAADDDQTLVRQTEKLLNEGSGGRRFECLNLAVHSYKMHDMTNTFLQRGLALKPATVVINASNNDIGANPINFRRQLRRLVLGSRQAGVRVLLVMEPNSLERDPSSLKDLHAIMAGVAARFDVPILDMHSYLAERYDDGFLWWDWVHLTSFGQQLFAERLVEELSGLGLVDPLR